MWRDWSSLCHHQLRCKRIGVAWLLAQHQDSLTHLETEIETQTSKRDIKKKKTSSTYHLLIGCQHLLYHHAVPRERAPVQCVGPIRTEGTQAWCGCRRSHGLPRQQSQWWRGEVRRRRSWEGWGCKEGGMKVNRKNKHKHIKCMQLPGTWLYATIDNNNNHKEGIQVFPKQNPELERSEWCAEDTNVSEARKNIKRNSVEIQMQMQPSLLSDFPNNTSWVMMYSAKKHG